MAVLYNNNKISFEDVQSLISVSLDQPFIKEIVSCLETWFDKDVEYIEFKTSGSTGEPKIIQHSKQNIINSALRTQSFFGYKQQCKTVLVLPTNFVAGRMMLYRAIVSDLDIVITNPSLRPFKNINGHFDFVPMTPLQLKESMDCNDLKDVTISKILLGGAPISNDLVERIKFIKIRSLFGLWYD